MTLTTDLVSSGAALSGAPLDVIPFQTGPHLTVSLTEGCEAPLEALRATSPDRPVRCHPCDEAVVRLMMGRLRRTEASLLVTTSISPGTLSFG
ncbi:MAG TPA: hypothetical protein VHX15_11895 [Frankiaceae bacterium]|nr:hypothetical protein [Frankiaceae bacterium]